MFIHLLSTSQNYLVDLLEKIDQLEKRTDSLLTLLQNERKKKKNPNKVSSREKELEKNYNDAMDLLTYSEYALRAEEERRIRAEEKLEEVSEDAKSAAASAERSALAAEEAIKQKDGVLADMLKMVINNSGFKHVNGIIVEGEKSKVTVETNIVTGETKYTNPKAFRKKLTHLNYEADWYLVKNEYSADKLKIEGTIVVYQDNRFKEAIPVNLLRQNEEFNHLYYYHSQNPALKLQKDILQKNDLKFAYVTKDQYDKDIIEHLSFWELCQQYGDRFLFTSETRCKSLSPDP